MNPFWLIFFQMGWFNHQLVPFKAVSFCFTHRNSIWNNNNNCCFLAPEADSFAKSKLQFFKASLDKLIGEWKVKHGWEANILFMKLTHSQPHDDNELLLSYGVVLLTNFNFASFWDQVHSACCPKLFDGYCQAGTLVQGTLITNYYDAIPWNFNVSLSFQLVSGSGYAWVVVSPALTGQRKRISGQNPKKRNGSWFFFLMLCFYYCWWFRNPARKPPGMYIKPGKWWDKLLTSRTGWFAEFLNHQQLVILLAGKLGR